MGFGLLQQAIPGFYLWQDGFSFLVLGSVNHLSLRLNLFVGCPLVLTPVWFQSVIWTSFVSSNLLRCPTILFFVILYIYQYILCLSTSASRDDIFLFTVGYIKSHLVSDTKILYAYVRLSIELLSSFCGLYHACFGQLNSKIWWCYGESVCLMDVWVYILGACVSCQYVFICWAM
jgi:hypothetical protein